MLEIKKVHYEYMLQLLFITKMYKECKWLIEESADKIRAKLKILTKK